MKGLFFARSASIAWASLVLGGVAASCHSNRSGTARASASSVSDETTNCAGTELRVKNYKASCNVTVGSAPPFTVADRTYCASPGTLDLKAEGKLASSRGKETWRDTTVSKGGAATLDVKQGAGKACVSVCCPGEGGAAACPENDPCTEADDRAAPGAGAGHGLVPCTKAGQTDCVSCGTAAAPAVCTETEAVFVAIDIAKGGLTAGTVAPPTGCYGTLTTKSCLNHGRIKGKECDDLGTANYTAANGFNGPAAATCLAALACQVGSAGGGCANDPQGVTACLCGRSHEPVLACSDLPSTSSFDGNCKKEELNGFGPPTVPAPGSPSAVIIHYTDPAAPAGMANNLVACAVNNHVSQCGFPAR
jgi:hypothetical protein